MAKVKNPPVDLNIVNRNTGSTNWVTANGVITPDSLTDVLEQTSDNASALNSLPTPLARFFVAREACRRVAEAKNANTANHGRPNAKHAKAGFAYEQLVSDCLDLYEIIFNIKYHRNIWGGTEDIEIIEWDAKEQMENIKNTMPKLHNSLNSYYWTDIKEPKLYFMIYKTASQEYLLGSSSPFTGWVTPPDLDKLLVGKTKETLFSAPHYREVRIPRKGGNGYYFDGKLLFENRSAEFQNYLYHDLFGQRGVNNRYGYINSYISSFQYGSKVTMNHNMLLKPMLTIDQNEVIVNGLTMGYNDEIDINSFFQSAIIKLPYRLSEKDFMGIKYERDTKEREYDFLIPLNDQGMSLVEKGATCVCHVRRSDVIVKLTFNGKEYTKTYEEDPTSSLKGAIKDLAKENLYVNVGLFPNILSPYPKENNFFKVALYEQDANEEYKTLTIDKCSLNFYRKNDKGTYCIIEELINTDNAINGVMKPIVRSRQINDAPSGSKYYEMYNSAFDAIEISIDGAKGMMIPVWRKAELTNDSYTYAIDLGTSNTFISRSKVGMNSAPVQLDMEKPITSYMHEYKEGGQYPIAYNIESAIPEDVRETIITEFAPPLIDGKQYDFPIRTALCHVKGTAAEPSLFDNTNIAFFYEKALHSNLQEILTDIKWKDNKERLSVFVQELMLIIKADILQRNGVLSQTNLVRFRPLSFDGNIKKMNDEIWTAIPEKVFGVNPKKNECFTESEAPYYYFNKCGAVNNTDSVSVIDIGGGSTDIVYFQANKPVCASSVHFGCDVLWGEGHLEFDNLRENGIFRKYHQALVFRDETLSKINSSMIVNANVSAKNIINFWLTNQNKCSIKENLRNDYAPLFVYHFTALIYYMASMYHYNGYEAPRTIVFSGNGSHYIDNFITNDTSVLQEMIKYIFDKVYGTACPDIYVTLPNERKESTCYGGLYRDPATPAVPEVVYHGVDKDYPTAWELRDDKQLKPNLLKKYKEMNAIYANILSLLKNRGVIDRSLNVLPFTEAVDCNYENNLTNHFRSEVTERYLAADDVCNDAVFFIPVVDKLFELTKVI